jgi:hypothetical protein
MASVSLSISIWKGIIFRHSAPSYNRYEIEHPYVTPNSIETSKDFVRNIAFGIEGAYDDPKACLSTVVQNYKNFTAGRQWAGHQKINDAVTLSTSNVGLR